MSTTKSKETTNPNRDIFTQKKKEKENEFMEEQESWRKVRRISIEGMKREREVGERVLVQMGVCWFWDLSAFVVFFQFRKSNCWRNIGGRVGSGGRRGYAGDAGQQW